jgi:DNA polymerase
MTEDGDGKVRMRRTIRMLDKEERRRHRAVVEERIGKKGMWPLTAPGMPPPGPDFLRVALDLGDDTEYVKGTKAREGVFVPGDRLKDLYRRALREPGFTLAVEVKKGTYEDVTFVPGHIWGQYSEEWTRSTVDANYTPPRVDGPHSANVFVLGKMPWREETAEGRNLVGATGEILMDLIDKLRIRHAGDWYVSNLVKFMPPDDTSTLRAGWVHDCLPLLHMELRIVRPRYILCLGADASKWLLGQKYNVSYMAGRVVPFSFPVHFAADEEEEIHTAQVMTVLHPAEVSRSPEKIRILQSNFSRFSYLITGKNFDKAEEGLDHRVCRTLEEAEEWAAEVDAEFRGRKYRDRLIGWDLEWEGQHPINPGSYIRTIQCSWGPKKAITFVVSKAGGKKAFRDRDGRPALKRLVKLLNRFMKDKRAVGHFLVSDLEWANHIGLNPIAHCQVPLDDLVLTAGNGKARRVLAWERLRRGEGWLDTAMMGHAIEETAPLGLEVLAMRYTTAPRYDIPLEDWKKAYCAEKGIKGEALEGYGNCPDEILIPYANYDADVTLRIALELKGLLDHDYDGNMCWEPFWESMAIQNVLLKIHKNGILVDRGRVDEHTTNFLTARAAMEDQIRKWARWPEFNIRSHQQVREFLFGERLNGKRDERGRPVRIRPRETDARSLYLEPLLDTSKPPRRWSDLKERGLDKDATPGTNKMILGILAQENLDRADQINWVRDYRFMDQVLKSVLRHPRTDEEDRWVENDEGFLEYDAGLAASIDVDGRVRTHLYPTAETGRWRSARPNLQNLCYDAETEILTRRGWVKFTDLADDDLVAQFWPPDSKIEFVRPEGRQVFWHDGPMRRITTERHVDLLVTPNHRCLLRQRATDDWFEVEADKFGGHYRHIHAGRFEGGQTPITVEEADWLLAACTLGKRTPSGNLRFRLWGRERLARLTRCVESLGGRCRLHADGHGVTVPRDCRPARMAREVFYRFGPWLLRYNRQALDTLAQRVFLWCRASDRRTECQFAAEENAAWVQALWTVTGWRARLRRHERGGKVSWRVDAPKDGHAFSRTSGVTNVEVDYKGPVYCVTVPSGWVVVRRDGKVSVSGNSKSRDPDYKRMLGEDRYKHKIRSILKAQEGYALIEFDYKGAELYGMAIMAGSKRMMEHCERANKYPEGGFDVNGKASPHGTRCPKDPKNGCELCGYPHPEYYDIHSNVAKLAFRLSCHPSKFGLQQLKKSHFRTLAKNVIFGIAYGRGAKAIALQAKEQGVNVTPEQAQLVIDAIFHMYPELVPFFDSAKSRAVNERWLCHCMGRFRRFPSVSDYKLEGEFERQAMNFPIQGMIASCVDRGLAYLDREIDNQGLADDIRLVLQMHDAGMVECRYHLVPYAIRLIKWAMVDKVPIYPTYLDGVPRGDGPYHLGLDFSVESSWGEKIPPQDYEKLGIPTEFVLAV